LQGIGRAQQAGVQLALEAVNKPFLLDTAKLLQMIDACDGAPILGIYLDVGNSTSSGLDPAAEVRAAQGRAVLTHIKDWNPTNSNQRLLGAGAVDFDASFAALREIGYDNYMIVELSPDPNDPDAVARHAVQFLLHRQ